MFDLHPESGVRYYYKNPTTMLPAGVDDSDRIAELQPYMAKSLARNLWISSSGLTVGLHFDPADNLNFQLRGRKSFMLYPPGVRAYYPLPMFSQTAHISGVFRDGPDPDLKKFSRFDPGKGTRIELQEGDVLYIPAYWWHQVESLGRENLNLNFWWLPRLGKQVSNWNQALRGHIQLALRYTKYGNIQQAPADKR
jgi:ribosomal protein L16 Arg81 hydroxylase